MHTIIYIAAIITVFFIILVCHVNAEHMTNHTNAYNNDQIRVYNGNKRDNHELANTVNQIIRKYQCHKTYITWILGHDKLTLNNPAVFERHNNYVRFYEWPLEKNDFDKPLMEEVYDDNNVEMTKNPETIEYEDVQKTCTRMSQEYIFSGGNIKKYRLNIDNTLLTIQHYVIIRMGDNPTYLIINNNQINNKNDYRKNNRQYLRDIYNINYDNYLRKLNAKLHKLCRLIIRESKMEYDRTGLGTLMCENNIVNYQIFKISIILKNNEPYILSVNDVRNIDELSNNTMLYLEVYRKLKMML